MAKLADVRDAPTRAAVTQCLVTAYKVAGDDAWKHIGRVGDLVKDQLEDKFAKTAKAGPQGDRRNVPATSFATFQTLVC